MDTRVNQGWTFSEVEEAKALITSFSNDYCYEDVNDKHNNIVNVLHAWFSSKTMQQVIDLYVDLVVEMQVMDWRDVGVGTTNNDMHDVYHATELVNNNFEMSLVEEATSYKNVVSCPSEVMGTMKMDETPLIKDDKVVISDNKSVRQPVAHTGRYWSTEEHRLFLRGLNVYGRGDWKNISKHFVTTRTPVQVSSHAQKYFRRLQSAASGKQPQRYSINDVVLNDVEPWLVAPPASADNSWMGLTFAGGHLDPALGQAPRTSSATTINNLAQLWTPLLHYQQQQMLQYQQQMMAPTIAAPMVESAGSSSSVPATSQQGGSRLPSKPWSMNNMQ